MKCFNLNCALVALVLLPLPAASQIINRIEKPSTELSSHSPNQDPENFFHTDILHYSVRLDLDIPLAELRGSVVISAKSLQDNVTRIALNANDLQITKVNSRLGELPLTTSPGLLEISLPQPLHEGDTLTVQIFYKTSIQNDGFGGLFYEHPFIYTIGEGIYTTPPSMTRFWLPCKDVPWDKATLSLQLIVPDGYKAVATGKLMENHLESATGKQVYTFLMDKPIATYLIAFAVSEFAVGQFNVPSMYHDSLIFTYYVQPEFSSLAEIDFRNVPAMVQIFEDRFGPYPFDHYSMAVVPMRGAMEHQTMTTYSSFLLTGDNQNDATVAHELAHQWWGDWVTLTEWDDIWLNEGFASYSEIIYLEQVQSASFIDQYLFEKAAQYFRETNALGYFSLAQPDYYWGSTVYEKGAWVLHMLRQQVGDEVFWKILQTYGSKHAYGNASSQKFLQVVNEVTGQDFTGFFDEWVFGSGHPILRLTWAVEEKENAKSELFLTIEQVQNVETVFHFDFDIDIYLPSDTLRKTITVTDKVQEISFDLNEIPIALLANPTQKVLAQFYFLSGKIPEKIILYQNYPNPFKVGESEKTILNFSMTEPETDLRLKIYDLLGRKVFEKFFKILPAGHHQFDWDGTLPDGSPLPSGVYYLILESPKTIQKKKLTILR